MYDVYNLSTHDPCVVIVNTFVSELLCSSRLNEQQGACVQNTNVRMHAVPRSRIYKLLPIPKRNKWWHDLPISLQNLLLRQELVTNIMPYQFFFIPYQGAFEYFFICSKPAKIIHNISDSYYLNVKASTG